MIFLTVQNPAVFNTKKNENTVASCRLIATKCQHRVTDTAHPPHFELREKRVSNKYQTCPHL